MRLWSTLSIKKCKTCLTKSSHYKCWELILKFLLISLYFVELSFKRFKEKDITNKNINLNDNSEGVFEKIYDKKELD